MKLWKAHARRPSSRRHGVLATTTLLLVGGLLAACGGDSTPTTSADGGSGDGARETLKITLGRPSDGFHTLLADIAMKNGYFKDEGFDVTMPTLGGDAGVIPAITSGSVQFAITTATPFLIAKQKGAAMQMISPMATYPEQLVLRGDIAKQLGITDSSDIAAKVAALKGRKIGVASLGGGLMYQLQAVLKTYNVDPKSMKMVAIKPYPAMLAALKRGDVEAIAPAAPYGTWAVDEKYGVMIADVNRGDVPSLRGGVFEVMSVNSDWVKDHPDAVTRMRAALQKAMDYLKSNIKGAAAIEAGILTGIDLSIIENSMGDGAGWPTSASLTQEQFEGIQKFNEISGEDTKSVTFQDAVWPPEK
jgi:NitT/TauT family transport system substrate-binding protein